MKSVTIHTDGACRGNPGPGGWGAALRYGDHLRELRGGELETTNNRMELMAAIEALQVLKRSCRVTLYTDSRYVRDGITRWLPGWRRRGWLTSARKPVRNQDLWRRLDDLVQRHDVTWRWVKGHAGNPGNERADALANRGLEEALAGPGLKEAPANREPEEASANPGPEKTPANRGLEEALAGSGPEEAPANREPEEASANPGLEGTPTDPGVGETLAGPGLDGKPANPALAEARITEA